MNSNTRWHRLTKSLKFTFIPFRFMNYVRIRTKNNKLYEGSSQADFTEIFDKIQKDTNEDSITAIEFEPDNRKIKKEVRKDLDPLFEKHFPSKLID